MTDRQAESDKVAALSKSKAELEAELKTVKVSYDALVTANPQADAEKVSGLSDSVKALEKSKGDLEQQLKAAKVSCRELQGS